MAKKTKYLPLRPLLKHMHACEEAQRWVARKKFKTFHQAVAACPDAGWLSWLMLCTAPANTNPALRDAEARAYRAGCDALDVYWKGTGNRLLNAGHTRKAYAGSARADAVAFKKAARGVWKEVEQALIRTGMQHKVWG